MVDYIMSGKFLRYLKILGFKIVYEFTPMYRLSKDGTLEKYEGNKWKPNMGNSNFEKEIGKENYERYRKWIISQLSTNNVLGIPRMRLWARWARKSVFTLIGICITIVGLMIHFPFLLGIIIGLPMSVISLCLNFLEEKKKQLIPMKKK